MHKLLNKVMIMLEIMYAYLIFTNIITSDGLNISAHNIWHVTMLINLIIGHVFHFLALPELLLLSSIGVLHKIFYSGSINILLHSKQLYHLCLTLLSLGALTFALLLSIKSTYLSFKLRSGVLTTTDLSLEHFNKYIYKFILLGFILLSIAIFIAMLNNSFVTLVQYKEKIAISFIGWSIWLGLLIFYKKISWQFKYQAMISCALITIFSIAYILTKH